VQKGDLIVVAFGEPIGSPGGTNTMKIVKVVKSASREEAVTA